MNLRPSGWALELAKFVPVMMTAMTAAEAAVAGVALSLERSFATTHFDWLDCIFLLRGPMSPLKGVPPEADRALVLLMLYVANWVVYYSTDAVSPTF